MIKICKILVNLLNLKREEVMKIPYRFGSIFRTGNSFIKEVVIFMLIFFILNLIFLALKLLKFGIGTSYAFEEEKIYFN